MFNSLNYIYLPINIKLIIFLFIVLGILIGIFLIKIIYLKNYFLIFIYKFLNIIFFLPLNFKKSKIICIKITSDILFIQDFG